VVAEALDPSSIAADHALPLFDRHIGRRPGNKQQLFLFW
jgi:hypothetical protein